MIHRYIERSHAGLPPAWRARLGLSGVPLPNRIRRRMERAFAADFGAVRLAWSGLPGDLGAAAFACGDTIHLGPAVAALDPAGVLHLLAHELTHVLQQRAGRVPDCGAALALVDDPVLEAEAERAAHAVLRGDRVILPRGPRCAGRSAAPVLQAIKLYLLIAGGRKRIGPTTLLRCIDLAVEHVLGGDLVVAPGWSDANGQRRIHMTAPGHWLWIAGGLATPCRGRHAQHLMPCILAVGHPTEAVDVQILTGAAVGSERVHFPDHYGEDANLDLSYIQIAAGFLALFRDRDADAARALLRMMMGIPTGCSLPERRFLAGMVALLFGVEASRSESSLASSVMLLDLIANRRCYGRQQKPFTLRRAFMAELEGEPLQWDKPYEHADPPAPTYYGGKYPQATYGTGPGNMSARRQMTDQRYPQWEEHLVGLHDRHLVPRREVTLFIHWLQARCPGEQIARWQDENQAFVQLVQRLVGCYQGGEEVAVLACNPHDYLGTHTAAVPVGGGMVWFHQSGFYYHNNQACRLIPAQFHRDARGDLANMDRLRWEEEHFQQPPGALRVATGWLSIGTVPIAIGEGKRPCPVCYRH
ncbi:MAG: DUF4157 domain-containing protein [Gemmatimonadales bacterium]|nr:DUF4157 domain-containing protein [Gemmatimonadales bacterium]